MANETKQTQDERKRTFIQKSAIFDYRNLAHLVQALEMRKDICIDFAHNQSDDMLHLIDQINERIKEILLIP